MRKQPSNPALAGMILLLIVATPALSGELVHATAYEIDVRFNPETSYLEASAVIWLREAGQSVDIARFWLHGELRVSEISANGTKLEYVESREYYRSDYALVGDRVEVSLPESKVPDRIEVKWSGYCHTSRARSPSDYMRVDGSGVFLRALGYSPWFPIFLQEGEDAHEVDFKRVSVVVPEGLTAVFSGELVSTTRSNGETRSTWEAGSLSLFDAQVTARQFVVVNEDRVAVYSLADKDSLSAAKDIVALTSALLEYYKLHYRSDAVSGAVHVVEMPQYGDISSANVVGIQEERWRGFGNSDVAKRTLAHELVHPFVRPAISMTDPLYALVIESFPSYFHYAALDTLGQIDYDARLSGIRESYLEKRRTGKDRRGRALPEEKPISKISADQIGVYKDVFVLSDRAVLFLHELRTQMGSERFEAFGQELFAREQLDDAGFRALVLEYAPEFETDLATWLDHVDLPGGLAE